jgi:hypothetical protein
MHLLPLKNHLIHLQPKFQTQPLPPRLDGPLYPDSQLPQHSVQGYNGHLWDLGWGGGEFLDGRVGFRVVERGEGGGCGGEEGVLEARNRVGFAVGREVNMISQPTADVGYGLGVNTYAAWSLRSMRSKRSSIRSNLSFIPSNFALSCCMAFKMATLPSVGSKFRPFSSPEVS